jgi:hypothetical protein
MALTKATDGCLEQVSTERYSLLWMALQVAKTSQLLKTSKKEEMERKEEKKKRML